MPNSNVKTHPYIPNRAKTSLLRYLAYATMSTGRAAYHVMRLRFGLDDGDWCENCNAYQRSPFMTMQAIGDHYGVSATHIKAIEAKALRYLRHHIPDEVTNDDLLAWTRVAPHYMIAIGYMPSVPGNSTWDARVAEHYEQYPNREAWKSIPMKDLIPEEPTFKKRAS